MSRLPTGGLIDRSRPLTFTFDGRPLSGFAGDTLASALIANDVKIVGRSFKYHRPRGIMTAGSEEPNALVTTGTGAAIDPNVRATTLPLVDGLVVRSQNRWPSLRFDLMAVNNLLSPLLVAGFYYKTFMWPAALWERLYEPLIRRAAGLGALSGLPDPDHYDREHAFCDLLVVGAGPAGLAAALAAARAGLRVLLIEQDETPGGRLLAEQHDIDGRPALDWVRRTRRELEACPHASILCRTMLFGAYDGQAFGAIEQRDHQPRQRYWKIVARRTVLATGAIERPLVFGGNDRPGVMMASAVQAYVHRFAAAPGKRVAVFTTTDSGWATAAALTRAGVKVAAVIDARADGAGRRPYAHGIERVFTGAVVADARGSPLRAIDVIDRDGQRHSLSVDLLAVSGGWNPVIGLGSHLGAKPEWDEAISSFMLRTPPPGMALAGAAAGRFSLAAAIRSGFAAGSDAAQALEKQPCVPPMPICDDEPCEVRPLWRIDRARGKSFVDFQHDVTDADVALSAREGFTSVEHLKRYTTLGMATDQGKTSQINGHALLAAHVGRAISEVGTVMSRPPFLPVRIGALAGHHRGDHFRPVRHTPTHRWAAEQGAVFIDAGLWKRAQYYPRPGEDWLQAASREARHVRSAVGICDVSTLGKIELHGADAEKLVDRLYANNFSNLPVGKARYGLMLREDGFVMDDGTVSRLAEDQYVITTSTANAATVMQHIAFGRQVLWPDLDARAVSISENWAQFAIAGPHARALLQTFLPDTALDNEAMPFMAVRTCEWHGIPIRLFRISFSGELAYELAVPSTHGDAAIRALMACGKEWGAAPYGTEALGMLRIEKGHPAGTEINGQTTARDLGLGRLVSTRKDFIGRALAGRPGLIDDARPALVGLKPVRPDERLRAGAHLLSLSARDIAANDLGHVTSAAFSPQLDRWIGLGLLSGGGSRVGEQIRAVDPVRGQTIVVEVCHPVFVDHEGERVRG